MHSSRHKPEFCIYRLLSLSRRPSRMGLQGGPDSNFERWGNPRTVRDPQKLRQVSDTPRYTESYY